MKDVTLIIQGKVSQQTLDFYIENYPTLSVIISTWIDNDLDISKLPSSYKLITQEIPSNSGFQNQNYQFVSTLNGLRLADTKFVIKIRGDEFYSNIDYIYSRLNSLPEKIHCSPVFFRHWSFMKFHISDHIIAGLRENVLLMFESAKNKVDNNQIFHIRDGKIHSYFEPEINLTRAYLMEKEYARYNVIDGRKLMVRNFEILDLKKMYPYKIVANIFSTIWENREFIPEKNYSISDIKQMFLSKEQVYDTDIS